MKNITYALFVSLLFTYSCSTPKNYLQECWKKQGASLDQRYLTFAFEENMNLLHHSAEPWLLTPYHVEGQVWAKQQSFTKIDSLDFHGKLYTSTAQLTNNQLAYIDFGEDSLSEITDELLYEHLSNSSSYTPLLILEYFMAQEQQMKITESDSQIIYSGHFKESDVKLFIDKSTYLINQITFLSHDNLYGDVLSSYSYSDYKEFQSYFLAQKVDISKINGQINDDVTIKDVTLIASYTSPISISEKYQVIPKEDTQDVATVTRVNDHIHFIELQDADNKTIVIEFDDFLCIAKAPLNSDNGALIIAEAQKIAPNKPIKYFIVGHHHPHSIGGIRSFVDAGAEIICNSENKDYLQFIIDAPRTLVPDALQNSKKTAQYHLVSDSMTISDGTYEMTIFNIGEISAHTKDFMMYYFPEERLLYQDDLTWMANEGPIKKAGKRQAGLYQAIVDRGLAVDTVFQSWPIHGYNVKSVIPFEELETSVKLEK